MFARVIGSAPTHARCLVCSRLRRRKISSTLLMCAGNTCVPRGVRPRSVRKRVQQQRKDNSSETQKKPLFYDNPHTHTAGFFFFLKLDRTEARSAMGLTELAGGQSGGDKLTTRGSPGNPRPSTPMFKDPHV